MLDKKTFYRTLPTKEQAVDFAEQSHGIIQEDGCTVKFEASYSISKALYNVKSDKYRVYVRIRPAGGNPLTYVVVSEYSKEAYEMARKRVKDGWF